MNTKWERSIQLFIQIIRLCETYEKEIVGDIIKTRIPSKWNAEDIFPVSKVEEYQY